MSFEIDLSKFCLLCGGKCCQDASWWIGGRLIWKGDIREIKERTGIDLIARNDSGIYTERPDVCKNYVCEDAIFGALNNFVRGQTSEQDGTA